ncbi:FAD-dependent oxidoreductase [Stygiolobus caldivivus]|uniref:FAD dependent oxidoreductase domain-containing protein n=1 Tax=Stygiolobus caldivivus TaxID=2824673 RepID=A0A8D5ZIF2_9CREN|nr:FAD-dependent oxidoreductase [Stygiolobus caldivivus]BCU69242.1 hypothetical protein KN1_05390 [Stygiolobus caldivivus]
MAETIIVGSGIVGAIAKEKMLEKGHEVKVIDKEGSFNKLNSNQSVWTVIPPLCGDLLEKCLHSIKYYIKLCEKYNVKFKRTGIISDKEIGKRISYDDAKKIESEVSFPSNTMLYYYEEGLFIDGRDLLRKINSKIIQGEVIAFKKESGKITELELSSGERVSVEGNVIFAPGYMTHKLFNIPDLEIYKGHLVISRSSFNLNTIIFYKGKIFLRDNSGNVLISSDTEKSSDGRINYEKVIDALNVVSSIYPLSNTLSISVGFRTASSRRKYVLEKVADNAVLVTGYRFGLAMTPFIIDEAISYLPR